MNTSANRGTSLLPWLPDSKLFWIEFDSFGIERKLPFQKMIVSKHVASLFFELYCICVDDSVLTGRARAVATPIDIDD
jgi:hypothetical protein